MSKDPKPTQKPAKQSPAVREIKRLRLRRSRKIGAPQGKCLSSCANCLQTGNICSI
jgi:hypothetical protein